jgi:hypothetical protein
LPGSGHLSPIFGGDFSGDLFLHIIDQRNLCIRMRRGDFRPFPPDKTRSNNPDLKHLAILRF